VEIKYQLEPRDLEWLHVFVHRGTVMGFVLRFLPWVGLLIAAAVGLKLFDPDRPFLTVVPLVVALGVIGYVWSRRHESVRKRASALFAPCTLSTSQDGIFSTAPGREGATRWSAIQGFGETPRHFFLMLDGASGFIVPKRALSPAEQSSFAEELARYSRPLPSQAETEGPGAFWRRFRVMLLMLALTVIYCAWHYARLQEERAPSNRESEQTSAASSRMLLRV
jgi:hypothetical protein